MREKAEQRDRPIAKIDSITGIRPESDEDGLFHARISREVLFVNRQTRRRFAHDQRFTFNE